MEDIIILSIIGLLTITAGCCFFLIRRHFLYWKRRKIPYLKPDSLIFGNCKDYILGRISSAEHYRRIYDQLAPHKFGGTFAFLNPLLVVRDPELIKHILVKDFQTFCDRSPHFVRKNQPNTRNLFTFASNEWKTFRDRMSPAFTPGKMKLMFNLIKSRADEFCRVIEENDVQDVGVDVTELSIRYAVDIINSCVFGLETNSLRMQDFKIREMVRKMFEKRYMFLIENLWPQLGNFLSLKRDLKEITNFNKNLVGDIIQHRNRNGTPKEDIFGILLSFIQTNKFEDENNTHVLDSVKDVMSAQSTMIYMAGVHAPSHALMLALSEIAKNSDVQRKLQEEIDFVLENHDGQITYESLSEMAYADQVISETLRMHASLPFLVRTCNENYKLPSTDVTIEKDTMVLIPILGIHYDPEYFPQPQTFNPDNFSKQAKESRKHYTYMPFGEGPRNCLAGRLGFMMVKVGLVTLLENFTFSISPKMELPVEMRTGTPEMNSKNPILLNYVCRSMK